MAGRAVILGSGTSNGVPSLGREYPVEFLAEVKNHRTRSSLLLEGPTGNVLVDCGPEVRLQLLREGVMDLEAVIVTHTHADHIMGLDDLRSFCLKYQRPVPIYTSPDYQKDIRRIFTYAFDDFPTGIWVPRFELRDVDPVLRLGGLEILTFWVEHGPWPVLALRVNRFAYVTDVSHIPDNVIHMLKGLDTLVLDAVRHKPHPNHFHFDKAVAVALELGAKQTFLTHLSDDFNHYETESHLPPGIRLAYDGLAFDL